MKKFLTLSVLCLFGFAAFYYFQGEKTTCSGRTYLSLHYLVILAGLFLLRYIQKLQKY